MKSWVYFAIFVLLVPFQAGLITPLSIYGIKPDLALACLFIVGLLTGPAEGAFAGMGMGLIQDIGSASLLGLTGLSRGMVGLASGMLGRKVLDVGSPSIVLFLAALSLAESLFIALFLQTTYGAVPFVSLIFSRMLPQTLYTCLAGFALLRLVNRRKVLASLRRRDIQKEL